MMALTSEQIETIAHLARLEVSEAQLPALQAGLSSILEFVSQLATADTRDVPPMAHPLPGLSQRLRTDEVTARDAHAVYQQNAPAVAAGLYLVPKVIE